MMELRKSVLRGQRPGPKCLITAGVHGDEFEGILATLRLLQVLDTTHLSGTVTLVPVVNELALEAHARCGPDGLDLARSCPGKRDGAPTEQVAAALSELIQAADYYIDLHSGGRVMDVYPLSGYMLVASPNVLESQRRMARAFGLPLVWGTSAELDGRSLSVARDAQVPAIYVEYRGRGACDAQGVHALTQGCQNVLSELGLLPQRNASEAESRIHEDPRPASGHMQVQNPAPSTGFFEPVVRLGQRVEQGQPLGILRNPQQGRGEKVLADHGGSLIVLRSYPYVRQGDALAVIVEDLYDLPACERIP